MNVGLSFEIVNPVLQPLFQAFPLKILNANLHESCVPQQDGQLS
jgi:hypothetical protein